MVDQIQFTNREEFRTWLVQHHFTSPGIWIKFSKLKDTIKPDEALEEALCFGWIDGQIKRFDELSYLKRFTPRKNGSKWSEKNRRLAGQLIVENRMTESGYKAIAQAKADGTWEMPKQEPINDEQINLLSGLIQGTEPAYTNFLIMSRSVKATYTAHYLNAKNESTKIKRLEQIISRLNENKKPM